MYLSLKVRGDDPSLPSTESQNRNTYINHLQRSVGTSKQPSLERQLHCFSSVKVDYLLDTVGMYLGALKLRAP